MIINHNLPAINAHRNLGINNILGAKTQEKLSSGLRINRAADDAAGLAISEGMRAQIRGLAQAQRNGQDAISLIQTGEGALTEVHSILDRMRELAVQAANDTYTPNDRNEMQKEINQLKSEIDRIANTTAFNNKPLLDGTASALATTDRGTTEVYMRGTLNNLGVSAAGTYKILIQQSGAGSAQTQVSNLMTDKNTGLYATGNLQLNQVANFYDVNGKFLLDNDQTITLVEGDGKTTSFTIAGKDTLQQVATKFASAMATGLAQNKLAGVSALTANLGTYVTAAVASGGALAVAGTFILASGRTTEQGNINVLADQSILNSFGFSEFKAATDSSYTVTITNVNTGVVVANQIAVKGNNILGQLHTNVDVTFDSNTGVSGSAWNASFGYISIVSDTGIGGSITTYVHLVDNSQTFQIGSNEMQNMDSAIGNMRSAALGVNNILITDVKSAGNAITKIDMAIARVSSQRSSLGAVQNRLEHTINNLGVAEENITASESRIRDADMAKEMMQFTRLQILQQASTAMLAQANQQPQQVLQLLGR